MGGDVCACVGGGWAGVGGDQEVSEEWKVCEPQGRLDSPEA